MKLHTKLGEKFDSEMTLEDEMGKFLPALQVFAMSIKYLADDMMKAVKGTLTSPLRKDDVHWVLTVPAIWTDAAKQFMRDAAIEAGLLTDKLTLALEPEAASIFCRHLSVDTAISGGNVSISKMSVGTRYIVVDAGGGTIDITVHEVVSANTVREIQAASGGGWGGTLVDRAFENLLIDLAGKDVYATFKETEMEDWIDLWRDFEVKKRTVVPKSPSARIKMKFPLSFSGICENLKQRGFKDVISSSRYSKDIEFVGDKIKFSAKLFQDLFEESIDHTVNHIRELLRYVEALEISAILLVGGYSESPMLQQAIKEAFTELDVIIPRNASSTVLKGALVFGHSPTSIIKKVSKYTCGVESTFPFRGWTPNISKKQKQTSKHAKDSANMSRLDRV